MTPAEQGPADAGRSASEQEDAFRRDKPARFEANAVRHLRAHLSGPTAAYTDDDLRRRARECVPRARAYGLTSERHIICFVDATYLLDERFDTDPEHDWAGKLLRSDKFAPGHKASVLLATAGNVYNGRDSRGGRR